MIYVLDSGCSFCIAKFMEFVESVDAAPVDSIIVVLDENQEYVLQYYMSSIDLEDRTHVHIKFHAVQDTYPYGFDVTECNVVLCKGVDILLKMKYPA